MLVAVLFHQLFEGLSLGVRISALPNGHVPYLKALLCFFFSITAPVGIIAGVSFFTPGTLGSTSIYFILPFHCESEGKQTGTDMYLPSSLRLAQMMLVQGLMSAISAGMLIYAACCELLAADFILDTELKEMSIGMQALALFSLFLGMAGMAVLK